MPVATPSRRTLLRTAALTSAALALAPHVRAQDPKKLHADKAYDYLRCRRYLRERGIAPRIARRGVEKGYRLGRHRWVVERTLAWLSCYRRLCVRYERRADIHEALLTLGCALICFNRLWRRF